MVIGWAAVNEPRFPVWPLIVAEAAANGTEPKFVSRPLDGPSMTHSTELTLAFLEVCVVWNEAPVVLSLSLRTKVPEETFVTSPVNESPGLTAMPIVTRLLGYISNQA